MSNLDAFLDELQEEIFDEAKQALGERGFERWRNPKYTGRMENPDGWGRVTGECGDTMEIYLKFKDNQVADASYFTDGVRLFHGQRVLCRGTDPGQNPGGIDPISPQTKFLPPLAGCRTTTFTAPPLRLARSRLPWTTTWEPW